MSESGIQALARAWVRIKEEVKFPSGYDGTASLEAHRAIEAIQEQIRELIVTTGDMRLFSLLQLLGQASLCMEQQLWPGDYDRMKIEVEEALRAANDPGSEWCSHEEVMRSIDKTGNRPC